MPADFSCKNYNLNDFLNLSKEFKVYLNMEMAYRRWAMQRSYKNWKAQTTEIYLVGQLTSGITAFIE